MYNADQKYEYIEKNEGRNSNLATAMSFIFKATEPIEESKGKDVAEFTVAEIMELYKSFTSRSFYNLTNRHSQLKWYAQWCLENNMIRDNQNHFTEISLENLKDCINTGYQRQGIMTRSEMESEIVQLLNARDQCLVYALFEGVQGKEFCELTELNVKQIKGNTLKLATRTIEVNPRLIELMRQSTEEYKYYSYGTSPREYPYDEADPNVFKKTYNSKQETQIRKRQRLYTCLQRIKEYLGNAAISATSLTESGRIDYIKSFMAKDGTDLEATVRRHEKEIINKYGTFGSVPTYLMNYGDYYRG